MTDKRVSVATSRFVVGALPWASSAGSSDGMDEDNDGVSRECMA
jgi:hypothetical protein